MCDDHRSIPTETTLQVLTDAVRRQIIHRLAETDTTISLHQLAETVDTTRTGAEAADRLVVKLHHVHLPLLADASVVKYDTATKRVRRGERFQHTLSVLDRITGDGTIEVPESRSPRE